MALNKLSLAALALLCTFLFVSFSLAAGYHILIAVPGLVYFAKEWKKGYRPSSSTWALIAMSLVFILSLALNPEVTMRNAKKTKYFFLAIFSIPALVNLFNSSLWSEKKQRIFLYLFFGCATLATVSGLIGLWSGFNPLRFKEACHETRACGMYGMYMTYGYGISLIATLLTAWFLPLRKKTFSLCQKTMGAFLAINILGLFLSYARGGWLGYLASLPLIFLKSSFKKVLLLSLIMVIFGAAAFFFVPAVKKTFLAKDRLNSNSIRISQFQAAWIAFKSSPLLGVGFRQFESQSAKIKQENGLAHSRFGGHAHNNYLEVLASTGALGLLGFLMFLLFWVKELWLREDLVGHLGLAFVGNFLVSGLFQNTFGDGENLFLIMGLYTISQIVRNDKGYSYVR